MKTLEVLTTSFLVISILSLAIISYNDDFSQAFAHHKPGHGGGPPNGGEEPPEEPPADSATIELVDCDGDKKGDKWSKGEITYRVINRSGEKQATIQAVIDGVEEWDVVKGQTKPDSPYSLKKVDDEDESAQITIKVFKKIIPGFILGFAQVCPDDDNPEIAIGQKVNISLGIKGLSTNGVKNLGAHEVGHALGLGHTINFDIDLMASSLDAKERKKLICPSNLNIQALTESGLTYTVKSWDELTC